MLYYTNANWQLQYQLLKPILQIMQIWGARKTRGAHIYIYVYINVTFQMFIFGLQQGYPDMRWTCPRWHPKPQAYHTERGFSLLAFERSKACSRARVGGESGGVDDCPRDLVERGRHQHWRGRAEIVISAPKGDFSLLRKRWKMWWKNAATVQPHFFCRLSKTSRGTSGECTGFRLQPCR